MTNGQKNILNTYFLFFFFRSQVQEFLRRIQIIYLGFLLESRIRLELTYFSRSHIFLNGSQHLN